MKKFKSYGLCAILFFAAPSHSAVQLSDNGQGEMLIAPFYSVANGIGTLISIKNTQLDETKAVKVRVNESKNGVAVLEFNLYLNRRDSWTGALTMNDSGGVNLQSNDQSCTVGFNSPQPLNGDRLIEAEPNVGVDDILSRIQTGSIEIYDMGPVNLPDLGCSAIDAAWAEGGQWAENPALGEVTGGLNATVTLIQVARGFAVTTPVTAFTSFYSDDALPHTMPSSNQPNLNDADRQSQLLVDGALVRSNWPSGFQSIAGLITYSNLSNDVNVSTSINGKAEWVYTFPTKSYAAQTGNNVPFNAGLTNDDGQLCMMDAIDCGGNGSFDRDGNGFCFLSIVSPPPPPSPAACQSTNVVVMQGEEQSNNITSELSNVYDIFAVKPDGWLNQNISNVRFGGFLGYRNTLGVDDDQIPQTYYGLPVVGFSFNQYTNANAQPGLLATYATADEFETTRRVQVGPQ